MIRLAALPAAFALGVLLCAPAFAQDDASIVIEIRNESSQAITRLNTYPVDADGEAIEDNLGALREDIPAGETARLSIDQSKCGPIRAYLGMADDSEIEGDIDTCKQRIVVISD